MKYEKIVECKFISRPNRFVAHVEIDGREEIAHVKNTGRCKELLLSGATVFLEVSPNPHRKTKFDLVAVYKGDTLVNMDSQAPNKVALEFLKESGMFSPKAKFKPEYKIGKSRIDIFVSDGERRALIEVKGVTLEREGVAMFPDAPTERGIKHVNELVSAMKDGYEAYVLFVIQMKGIHTFKPNDETHKAFGDALRYAAESGVKILAYDCVITHDEMAVDAPVKVKL